MNRFDIEFWNGMNKAALKASKLVEKAKSIDEARNNVKDLLKRIEEYLSTHPEYTSLADFVKEAVREKLDSLGKK